MSSGQVETLGSLERRLTMSVPVADIDHKVDERLRTMARRVSMPGFRPGKVPLKVVAQQYGPQVRGEVIGNAVEEAFRQAVQSQNLRVAGYPRIERKDGGPAERMEFSATFEIYPEIALADFAALQIERPVLEVGDKEIDRTVESLRKQRATFEPATRPAEAGDRVRVDFVGRIEGAEFAGGRAEGVDVTLGEGRMLPDFERGLTGMSAGESRTFAVEFPADYAGKEVAGKTAQFEARVTAVEIPRLPEVDAEFAKSLGVPDGDVAKMRGEIRENVEREVKQRLGNAVKQRVMQALLDSHGLETPKTLVEMEQSRLVDAARKDLEARGMKDADKIPIDPAMFRDQAVRRVNLGLILAEIVRQHKLEAKPEQVRKLVEDYARTFEQPFEVVKWIYSQPQRLAEFEGMIVEENVVGWVLSKAKVQDKPVDFLELTGGGG